MGARRSDSGACPIETLPDMNAPSWAGPQPSEPPCPTCTAVPDPPHLSRVSAFTLTPEMLEEKDGGEEPSLRHCPVARSGLGATGAEQ